MPCVPCGEAGALLLVLVPCVRQEHFYLEPHALLAKPGERYGEMEVISCTQCVAKSAKCVAMCLETCKGDVVLHFWPSHECGLAEFGEHKCGVAEM